MYTITWGKLCGERSSKYRFSPSLAKELLSSEDMNYESLDAEAAVTAPGSEGLLALVSFQGSRTPVTDPYARGALMGLNLKHTRGHIWRALMEAVCFGTRSSLDDLEKAGHRCDEIVRGHAFPFFVTDACKRHRQACCRVRKH